MHEEFYWNSVQYLKLFDLIKNSLAILNTFTLWRHFYIMMSLHFREWCRHEFSHYFVNKCWRLNNKTQNIYIRKFIDTAIRVFLILVLKLDEFI